MCYIIYLIAIVCYCMMWNALLPMEKIRKLLLFILNTCPCLTAVENTLTSLQSNYMSCLWLHLTLNNFYIYVEQYKFTFDLFHRTRDNQITSVKCFRNHYQLNWSLKCHQASWWLLQYPLRLLSFLTFTSFPETRRTSSQQYCQSICRNLELCHHLNIQFGGLKSSG